MIDWLSVAHVWRSEKNLWESVSSFYLVGPGYGTQIIRLGHKHLYFLSQLVVLLFSALLWRGLVSPGVGRWLCHTWKTLYVCLPPSSLDLQHLWRKFLLQSSHPISFCLQISWMRNGTCFPNSAPTNNWSRHRESWGWNRNSETLSISSELLDKTVLVCVSIATKQHRNKRLVKHGMVSAVMESCSFVSRTKLH